MDPSTKGLTTVITAAGLNCKPKQKPPKSTLHAIICVFKSKLQLSYKVFLKDKWIPKQDPSSANCSWIHCYKYIQRYWNSFPLSNAGMFSHEKACKWGQKGETVQVETKKGKDTCRWWKRKRGHIHIVPGFTITHTCRHLLSLFVSLLSIVSHLALSLYGHFTLTTGGLFVSLSGFASHSGHLREQETQWQNEYTLEPTLFQKHIYRQVVTDKHLHTHTQSCARTHTHTHTHSYI